MTTYQLTGEGFVYRWGDGVRSTIPLADDPGLPPNPDAVEYRAWLAAGGVPLPAELLPAAEIAAGLRLALAAEYRKHIQVIAAGYPLSERESWPVQTEEARALESDPAAATPWIDAAALARGLDRLVLAEDRRRRALHNAWLRGQKLAVPAAAPELSSAVAESELRVVEEADLQPLIRLAA